MLCSCRLTNKQLKGVIQPAFETEVRRSGKCGFCVFILNIMSKLGYTWYPKDWGNSESVFELNLSERGLYRELIDLAMLNDNKTEIKLEVWSRKFAVNLDDLKSILGKLSILGLTEVKGDLLFIPSCESRLNLVRGGSNGGKKSKPTKKPILKPIGSLDENKEKPTSNQIEKKVNIKEKETKIEIENKTNKNDLIYFELSVSEQWLERTAMQSSKKLTIEMVKDFLKSYNEMLNVQFDFKNNKTDYCTHFINWLNKQEKPIPKNTHPARNKIIQ